MAPRKQSAARDREIAKVQLAGADADALSDNTREIVKGAVIVDEETDNAVEGEVVDAPEYDTITLKDKEFRVRPVIGAMAMFKWAAAADMDTDDPRALAAIYAMLKSCILKEDWRAFEEHALDNDAEPEDLLDVITDSMELVSGRPTKEPSDS